jgi:transcriptional regulator with XRE-family HTH domain
MKTFSEQIKASRERKGLSQESLGKMLGVSQQTVAQWESGKAQPRRERRKQLLQIFGTQTENATTQSKRNKEVHLGSDLQQRASPLAQLLPAELHSYLDREIRMGGEWCTVNYISDRAVFILYDPPAQSWEDLAPDLFRLAVASHLNDVQGHHKDCTLVVMQQSPNWPQGIQGAMFGAGVLGVNIQFAQSLEQAAQLILQSEGLTS